MPPLPGCLVVPVAPASRVVAAELQGLRARVVAAGAWIAARHSRYRTTRHTLQARIVRQELPAPRTSRRSCRCFGRRRYTRFPWHGTMSSRSRLCSSCGNPREAGAHGEGSEAPQGHSRQGRRDSEESSKHAEPIQLQIDHKFTRSTMPEVQGPVQGLRKQGPKARATMSKARATMRTTKFSILQTLSC